MSLTSKITLTTCIVVSASIIGYVHFKQQYDRKQMQFGVIKDLERQRQKKIQNIILLTHQQELTKELQKESVNKNVNNPSIDN